MRRTLQLKVGVDNDGFHAVTIHPNVLLRMVGDAMGTCDHSGGRDKDPGTGWRAFTDLDSHYPREIFLQNSSAGRGRRKRRLKVFSLSCFVIWSLVILGALVIYFTAGSGNGDEATLANPYFEPETNLNFSPVQGESMLILAQTIGNTTLAIQKFFANPEHNESCHLIPSRLEVQTDKDGIIYGIGPTGFMAACINQQYGSTCYLRNPYRQNWMLEIVNPNRLISSSLTAPQESPVNWNNPQASHLDMSIGGVMVGEALVLQNTIGQLQIFFKRQRSFLVGQLNVRWPKSSCPVSMDNHIVVTGGTSPKGRKPLKLVSHYILDQNHISTGGRIPDLNSPRSFHGCAKVSLRNETWLVVVAGIGRNHKDRRDLEIIPWKPQGYNATDRWVSLRQRLNQGRGQNPVLGMVGNNLHVVGGYSHELEQGIASFEVFDEVSQKWIVTVQIQSVPLMLYSRQFLQTRTLQTWQNAPRFMMRPNSARHRPQERLGSTCHMG
eukprot:maker-scaffold59_size442576-snap-gene-2.12 protein:Tk11671 transcript:maker-scaffold59_size442576-snap-gene-2.12-mRNA-1 annotation:"kelch-like protein 24-like isoform x1"